MTISDLWTHYAAHVLPAHCSEIQRTEMRRAFYAGAHILLEEVLTIGDDAVSEDAGMARLAALRREIDAFFKSLAKGDN